MADITVILLEPRFAGNIGFVARSMANFGFEKLILVNPCELGDDAYRFSKHARPIIERSKTVKTFDEAVEGLDLIVGTSGVLSEDEKKFNRHPMTPREFTEHVRKKKGQLGLVFGREDQGLNNQEIAKCDILVTIPTSPDYPIMNISHAATILFYELGATEEPALKKTLAGSTEKDKLNELFARLLDDTNYPEHKKPKTKVMFRRIVARADLSNWEFHTLAGVISRASKSIKRGKRTSKKK